MLFMVKVTHDYSTCQAHHPTKADLYKNTLASLGDHGIKVHGDELTGCQGQIMKHYFPWFFLYGIQNPHWARARIGLDLGRHAAQPF